MYTPIEGVTLITPRRVHVRCHRLARLAWTITANYMVEHGEADALIDPLFEITQAYRGTILSLDPGDAVDWLDSWLRVEDIWEAVFMKFEDEYGERD